LSQGHRFTHRGVNASGSSSGDRGNVLTVETYGYIAVCRRGRLGGARRFGAHRGRRGAGTYSGGRPPTDCYDYILIRHKVGIMTMRNSAIAEKPRDACLQYAVVWPTL